ncbi:hypothetical protein [Cylindrospermopsis raciborskii]|uniref:hypothetical protein n=1 Tax=Cylindrospermopsis raciborskii TaxID=77022 RepID=UPI0011468717|nr:hypothetical protein [Cylindrospermopsis raciborskii]
MTFLIHERANNRNNLRVMSKIFKFNKFYLYSSSIHKLVVRSCYGRLRSTRTREIAFRVPRVSSQGKNLNVLRGDCITPPTGDCAALPLGDRS